MAKEHHTGRSKYKGLTKKEYLKRHGSSTPGSEKSENCKATPLDKALCKYNRSWKNFPTEYEAFWRKKRKYH